MLINLKGQSGMTSLIANHNPNNEWGHSVVEIILKMWSYEKTYTVKIGGNCHGLEVLEGAVGALYDSLLPDDGDALPTVVLTNKDGETLECEDGDDEGEDWIKKMVASVRIVDYIQPTLNEIRKLNGAKPVPDGDKPYEPLGHDR